MRLEDRRELLPLTGYFFFFFFGQGLSFFDTGSLLWEFAAWDTQYTD